MLLEKYILESLVKFGSNIDEDTQREIIKDIFDVFVNCQNNMLHIYQGLISRVDNKDAFGVILLQWLRREYPEVKLYEIEDGKPKYNLNVNDIYHTINSRNRYDELKYENDPFLKHQKIEKDDVRKIVTVVTNNIHIKKPDIEVADSEYREVVEDYKQHFPYFDDLLKLIVDMRFAKNRKSSFLHLRVRSNWGKSFLSAMLQNLQIGIEVDYHNLMNKSTNDISPIQVRNTFVMMLDEFNTFSAEMKKLSHNFKFAPKFGMSETVPLYLKILFSAEKSPSFSGEVDEQIINRVMVMDIPDEETIPLDDREVYRRYGNAKYMAILLKYAYKQIKTHIDHYLSMDRYEAHKRADEAVLLMRDRLTMRENVENLSEAIREMVADGIDTIINSSVDELPKELQGLKPFVILLDKGKYKGAVAIRYAKKVTETIIAYYSSKSQYKKMKYKVDDINAVFSNILKVNHTLNINGFRFKALIIDTVIDEEAKVEKVEKVEEPKEVKEAMIDTMIEDIARRDIDAIKDKVEEYNRGKNIFNRITDEDIRIIEYWFNNGILPQEQKRVLSKIYMVDTNKDIEEVFKKRFGETKVAYYEGNEIKVTRIK